MDEDARSSELEVAKVVEYELGCLDRKHAMGYLGNTPEYHAGYFAVGPIDDTATREQRAHKEIVNRGWH